MERDGVDIPEGGRRHAQFEGIHEPERLLLSAPGNFKRKHGAESAVLEQAPGQLMLADAPGVQGNKYSRCAACVESQPATRSALSHCWRMRNGRVLSPR